MFMYPADLTRLCLFGHGLPTGCVSLHVMHTRTSVTVVLTTRHAHTNLGHSGAVGGAVLLAGGGTRAAPIRPVRRQRRGWA